MALYDHPELAKNEALKAEIYGLIDSYTAVWDGWSTFIGVEIGKPVANTSRLAEIFRNLATNRTNEFQSAIENGFASGLKLTPREATLISEIISANQFSNLTQEELDGLAIQFAADHASSSF